MKNRLLTLLVAISAAAFLSTASAQTSRATLGDPNKTRLAFPETEQDISKLPKFCQVRLRHKRPQYKQLAESWAARVGRENWVHMHHYCFGLHQTRLAPLQRDPKRRTTAYQRSIKEFSYILSRATPRWPYLAQGYYNRGRSYLEVGATAAALRDLNHAIKLKPRASAPYLALSRFYEKTGQAKRAVGILNEGIRQSPKSKALKRRLARLENKKT
ncbi:MAG: tetratricopeptide repeat protein [Gammaproteobacteria bacterium]|nr:tetratricopeptide repeat protein [Gammaproteobacteria bacterium]